MFSADDVGKVACGAVMRVVTMNQGFGGRGKRHEVGLGAAKTMSGIAARKDRPRP